MCKVFGLHPSGYSAWRSAWVSTRANDDARVLGLIKQFWLESGGVYGCRKITRDLRNLGETQSPRACSNSSNASASNTGFT
ncbi:IS3 family transposase [Xanthomonas fragariae]|uniref:IS3 family transposase n=1 Tax=Xanthomonas fragariae TaxID=48664 RepID=UPI000A35C3E1|nr:Transposase [Xanthomonas fragariae]